MPSSSSPRVSVVIPAFQNAEYLAETIESVLKQTFTDFELIVADHSSTDGSHEVALGFAQDPRVTVLTTEAGGGAKRNWDRVSQAARGELIKLLPGDDTLLPTCLEEQVAAFDAHPSAVLVASRRTLTDAKGKPIVASRGLPGLSGLVSGRDAVRATVRAGSNIFGEPGCVLMRRDLLEAKGWWDDTDPYLIDEATYAAVALEGDVVAIDRPLATFRVSVGQWSVRLARQQAGQAAAFHRRLRAADPTLLSATDVRIGNAKALATSFLRRAAYVVLRRRMS